MEEVGSLKVNLGLDSADFTKNITDINRKLKVVESEFKVASTSVDGFGSSVDDLKSQSEHLSTKLQLQAKKVEALRDKYEESVKVKGEEAKETENLLIRYNKTKAFMNSMQKELDKVNGKIDDLTNSWSNLSKKLAQVSDSMKAAGDKLKDVGETLAKYVTLPLTALSVGSLKVADDFDAAQDKIQAQLGLTAKEAEKHGEIVEGVWKDAYGDNLDEVSKNVALVARTFDDLPTDKIENITEQGYIMQDAFGVDIADSVRSAKVLMDKFAYSSELAFDYIFKGYQKNLDYSGEFLDSINEYSTYFDELGFKGEEMFDIFYSGAESGVFQLDKVGDGIKEFAQRAKDSGDSTKNAFEGLNLNAEEMMDSFNEGGVVAQKAFKQVVTALQSVEDKTKKNQITTDLFGTQYEDLGKEAFNAMLKVEHKFGDVEGATKKAGETLHANFGTDLKTFWREFQKSLVPVGEVLIQMARDWIPPITSAISSLANWFKALSPAIQKVVIVLGGFAAAIGPVLVVIGTLVSSIGSILGAITPVVTTIGGAGGLSAVLAAITGPIGIAVAAIGGLIGILTLLYKKNERFRNGVKKSWEDIKGVFNITLGFISDIVQKFMGAITEFFNRQLEKIKGFWNENVEGIMDIVEFHFGYISGMIEVSMSYIQLIFTTVWPIIEGIVKMAWESIKFIITNVLDVILGIIKTFIQLFQGDWEGAWNTVKETVMNIWENIKNYFSSLGSILFNIGEDIMQGLVDGIGNMRDKVMNKAKSIANAVKNTIKDALNINSPSKVMMDLGQWIPIGLAEGMERNMNAVIGATNNMAQATIPRGPNFGQNEQISNATNKNYSTNVTNHFHMPVDSPSQIARKQQQSLRQLALEWGMR
ncbi:phage tail tape measure protein [Chengkuizengella marina]|uniref:Phage tail tape measure protein n=1 Tax=Chengkuizengella marina TaxID=2507566 RepID=A0A6N9Q7V1_9BACL|nr:phage tail tape measure protein [Chengkuizengella marina]NBI30733.1 phage tail tape measure protein [Chengkuizengella marina]